MRERLRSLEQSRWWRVVRPFMGPLVIVATAVVASSYALFSGLLPTGDHQLLTRWLPAQCFLGQSLSSGILPMWSPHLGAGAPFLADPQSGWLYLVPMGLYSALPCDSAALAFVALQPFVAGLGLYWFLRSEGATRIAACVGGVALAAALGGVGLQIELVASLAWTALLLAAASRMLRVRSFGLRLLWLALVALAWGQLLAPGPGAGVAIGSVALVLLLAYGLFVALRRGSMRVWEAPLLVVLVPVALLGVNLGLFIPRTGPRDLTLRSSVLFGMTTAEGLLWLGAAIAGAFVVHEWCVGRVGRREMIDGAAAVLLLGAWPWLLLIDVLVGALLSVTALVVVGLGVVVARSEGWRATGRVAVPLVVALGLSGAVLATRPPVEARPGHLPPGAPRLAPYVPASSYTAPGPLLRRASRGATGRMLGLDPSRTTGRFGRLRGIQVARRSDVLEMEEAQSYGFPPGRRYRRLIEEAGGRTDDSAAFLRRPSPAVLDLFAVQNVITPGELSPEEGARKLGSEGEWALWRLRRPTPKISVVTRWEVVRGPGAALRRVLDPKFNSDRSVVLEQRPRLKIPKKVRESGRNSFRAVVGSQSARIRVRATRPAVVVVRTPYESGWSAKVDGRKHRILRADYLMQAIPVPQGRHRIVLSFDDPSIAVGLLWSGVSLGAVVVAGFVLWLLGVGLRRRRRKRAEQASEEPAPAEVASEEPVEQAADEEDAPAAEEEAEAEAVRDR